MSGTDEPELMGSGSAAAGPDSDVAGDEGGADSPTAQTAAVGDPEPTTTAALDAERTDDATKSAAVLVCVVFLASLFVTMVVGHWLGFVLIEMSSYVVTVIGTGAGLLGLFWALVQAKLLKQSPRKPAGALLGIGLALAATVAIWAASPEPPPGTAATPEESCAPTTATASRLGLGEPLTSGESVSSPDGRYLLTMRKGGGLALCDTEKRVQRWVTNTENHPGAQAALKPDGNFVVVSRDADVLWATDTDNTEAEAVTVENDGRVVLHAKNDHRPLWHSDGVATVLQADPPRALDRLSQWEVLRSEQFLQSPNGHFRLTLHKNGDLVLRTDQTVLWNTNTAGYYEAALAMQHDGNLVLYADPAALGPGPHRAPWASNTDIARRADLVRLDNEGVLALYDQRGEVKRLYPLPLN